ncbi:flagellar biosynthesis protein FlgN [Oceaniglobus trochenteri]|uniref:flagellar biosynthesis protein FlgN n=1 Tax=Oceaniglobus trochenteri TaxID=2763260 RepID=UPI001CFFFFC7|nr:flagellar biosynthesis protein FlgN [Oceaniglobus trochenteri]
MERRSVAALLKRYCDEERRHLLSGDLERLRRVSGKKERLLTALASEPVSEGELRRLAELSERNRALLSAAQEGIRSAMVRLADLRRGMPTTTYSANGAKSEFAAPVRTLQRRA